MVGFLIRAAVVAVGLWVASIIAGRVFFLNEKFDLGGAAARNHQRLRAAHSCHPHHPDHHSVLGLFLLVINGLMVELAAYFQGGFHVAGLGTAILVSLVVSLTSWVISWFVGPSGLEVVVVRR